MGKFALIACGLEISYAIPKERLCRRDSSVHLNALSGVFRRAASEGYVCPGYNPVAAMLEKPAGHPAEARWLEVPDAALLFEAGREPPEPDADQRPPA